MNATREPWVPAEQRPCSDRHTASPVGYFVVYAWAQKMLETHRQEQCPECGLWVVWVPKEEGR